MNSSSFEVNRSVISLSLQSHFFNVFVVVLDCQLMEVSDVWERAQHEQRRIQRAAIWEMYLLMLQLLPEKPNRHNECNL